MPTVADILRRKGTYVHTIDAGASVLTATQKMNEHKVGALIVTVGGRIAGMFTERDVLTRVVAQERAPGQVAVGEVMTRQVLCVGPATDLDEASRVMTDHRVRHLPVCTADGALLGMVSIGDINAYHASEQEVTIHFLHEYIYGRA